MNAANIALLLTNIQGGLHCFEFGGWNLLDFLKYALSFSKLTKYYHKINIKILPSPLCSPLPLVKNDQWGSAIAMQPKFCNLLTYEKKSNWI